MAIARSPGNDLRALAGRLLIAALFIASGISKLIWPLTTIGYVQSFGLPAPMVWCIGSMLLELACGALLVAGYRTRAVAGILAAYCVLTALLFHHDLADQNQLSHFLKNFAMAGGLLALSIGGAGAFSMDRLMDDATVAAMPEMRTRSSAG